MKRALSIALALLLASGIALAQTPSAQPTATARPAASAMPSPSAAPASSAGGQLPPGHPPAGHPPTGQEGQQRQRLPDRAFPDEKLPPGTVAVMILDADDRPVPNAPIALAVLFSSVTKGESKDRIPATTDETGTYTFTDLKYSANYSYRLTTTNGPAEFTSQAFSLNDQNGVRVLQHRYDAVTRLAESRMLFELHMILDVKQDNMAVNHLLIAVNLGREAYVANDVRIPLPAGAEAFSAQESADGIGMAERDGAMVLEGTFPPGQNQITYRYQVPLDGGDELSVTLPTPPRIAASRVVLKANEQMTLNVAGLPPAERGRFNDGSKVHEARSKAPQTIQEIQAVFAMNTPGKLDITVKGIPTPGLKRTLAVLIALLAMAGGIFHVYRRKQSSGPETEIIEDLEQAQQTLLDEIALLEKLRKSGEIGPRTYRGLREQLLDALARIMARLDEAKPKKTKKTKKAKAEKTKTKAGKTKSATSKAGKGAASKGKKRRKKKHASAPT